MIEALLGLVGSPLDVLTLGYLGYELRTGKLATLREEMDVAAAGVVALARDSDAVDEHELASDLDVLDRDAAALMTDGGSTDE